jgi:voltage-gated potassium channel
MPFDSKTGPVPGYNRTMEERHPPLLWQLVMLLASVITVATLALSFSIQLTPDIESMLRWADTMVCAVFLADFCLLLHLARNKKKYLFTWGWIDLLSSIPLIPALQLGRFFRILRILRLLRGVRLTATLIQEFTRNRRQTAAFAILLLTGMTISFSSIAILIAEKGRGQIDTPGKALWWCMETIATVGYGDVAPQTTLGRIVAGITMIMGIAIFGSLTAVITSLILEPKELKDPILAKLEKIEAEIAKLRSRLEES